LIRELNLVSSVQMVEENNDAMLLEI